MQEITREDAKILAAVAKDTPNGYLHVHSPTRGMITNIPPTVLPKEASPSLLAMKVVDGELCSDTGYVQFPVPSTTKTNYLHGTFLKFHQFVKFAGTTYPIALTSTNAYLFNTSSGTWDNIQKGQTVEDCEDAWVASANVTCTADGTIKLRGTNSAKAAIGAAFTTGLAAYENIGPLDLTQEGSIHFWIYSSVAVTSGYLSLRISEQANGGTGATYEDLVMPAIAATTWTPVCLDITTIANFNAVLSVGLVVNTDFGAADIYIDDVRSVDRFTGDEDNRFSVDTLDDTFLITNGIDQPKKYDGTNMTDLTTTLATGSITTSELVLVLKDHVLLMNNTENGADAPQRVSWSNVGQTEDYINGTAGYQDLVDDAWWIIAAKKLGDDTAVIYKEGSIVLCQWVGGQNPFRFTQMVNDQGIAGKDCVDDVDGLHIVMGLDRIYVYNGGREIVPIDDSNRTVFYDSIDFTYINRSIVYDDHTNDHELNIWIPTADTIPDIVWVYQTQDKIWTRSTRTGSGFGNYKSQSTLTIGDLVGTIGDQNYRIGDSLSKSNTPTILIGDDVAGVYQLSSATYNNNGAAISNVFETPDFSLPSNDLDLFGHVRVPQLFFEAKGVSVTTRYSIDGGETWSPTQGASTNVVSLTSSYRIYQQDFDVVAHKIRFQFRNDSVSSYFYLKYYGFMWKRRSSRL